MISLQEPLAAVHLLKELVGYIKEKANHDQRLMEMVNEVYNSVLDLRSENLDLRIKCDELMQKASIKDQMVFDSKDHVYFRDTESGRDGPFCQTCYDRDQKLSRPRREQYGHECTVCKTFVYDETGRSRQAVDVERMNDALVDDGHGAW
ncbi:MAG TPA: hypothetical protein DEV75_12215 [Desulfovibrio sp.]|jgi:hypothetical protein|nr:hypothetical protein [Desulfovibrio sp.]